MYEEERKNNRRHVDLDLTSMPFVGTDWDIFPNYDILYFDRLKELVNDIRPDADTAQR